MLGVGVEHMGICDFGLGVFSLCGSERRSRIFPPRPVPPCVAPEFGMHGGGAPLFWLANAPSDAGLPTSRFLTFGWTAAGAGSLNVQLGGTIVCRGGFKNRPALSAVASSSAAHATNAFVQCLPRRLFDDDAHGVAPLGVAGAGRRGNRVDVLNIATDYVVPPRDGMQFADEALANNGIRNSLGACPCRPVSSRCAEPAFVCMRLQLVRWALHRASDWTVRRDAQLSWRMVTLRVIRPRSRAGPDAITTTGAGATHARFWICGRERAIDMQEFAILCRLMFFRSADESDGPPNFATPSVGPRGPPEFGPRGGGGAGGHAGQGRRAGGDSAGVRAGVVSRASTQCCCCCCAPDTSRGEDAAGRQLGPLTRLRLRLMFGTVARLIGLGVVCGGLRMCSRARQLATSRGWG